LADVEETNHDTELSMSETPIISRLDEIFKPTPRGVVGLVDDLLRACPAAGLELDWHDERCRVQFRNGNGNAGFETPLPKSVFRAALARIAALCNEHRPNSVTPYGGTGEFQQPDGPAMFVATFVNAPSDQKLVLTPMSTNGR
jgi:hypothetical protein